MYHISQKEMEEAQMGFIAISSLVFLGGMYLMIAFAWWILQIIANWRIFIKAGEDGWKSIIPIYGDYISYKIAWQPAYFWLTLVLGIVSSCLQGTLETNDSLMISMSIVLIKIILAIIFKERTKGGLNKRATVGAPLFSTLLVFPN